jgi:aspartate 1-decarboxylase
MHVDPNLLDAADIIEHGAAARLVHRGDTIIVISAQYDAAELEDHLPRVVHVQTGTNPNQITSAGDAAAAAPAV